MTKFTIMDVGHGNCCYLIAENSNLMVFDCGHKSEPENRPSDVLASLGQATIELFVVSNYDEDHISDLENLRSKLDIKQLLRNKSIDKDQLRKLKLNQSGKITDAMESMLEMIGRYTDGPMSPPPEFPNIQRAHFNNNHPFSDGNDTNNLSLVTLLDVHDETLLIPGDMEKGGWEMLLAAEPSLCSRLKDVTCYIASHHGRFNGYHEEIFTKYNCRPNVFVFSDSGKIYDTQETDDLYRQWANGINFNGETRKILTTRKDGSLTWSW